MAWWVTLVVKDCANPSTLLAGAAISDGYVIYYTDANGEFIAVIDDAWAGYVVSVSKIGYVSKNVTLTRSVDHGTTKEVCLNPAGDGGGGGGGGGGISCFIATAATGSALSEEVTRLRALRDRVSVASPLSRRLIDAIYEEYFRFSPAIAAELAQDSFARQGVHLVVVRPLVAWYTLAGALAFEGRGAAAVASAVKDVADARPRFLGPSSIVSMLEAIRTGAELPHDAPQLLRDLEPRMRQAAALPLASWAILDPLCRIWSAAGGRLDVVDEVAAWLGAAPLDALPAPADPSELGQELEVIARFLAFDPAARRELGGRLLRAWPDAAVTLARTGFVAPGNG